MPTRLGLALLLAAGLTSPASAQGTGQFDGQYVGELTLTRIIKGDCTTPPLGAEYPLTIAGGRVLFKYVPRFDTTLTGSVDAKGNFKATAQLHHGVATMTGHIDGIHATATIVSPSCKYAFETK